MQDDAARAARLRKAQEDFQAEDEHTGGQQANTLLLLQKEGKLKAKQALTSTEPTVKKDGKDPPPSGNRDEQVDALYMCHQQSLRLQFCLIVLLLMTPIILSLALRYVPVQDTEPEQADEETETARMFREAAEALKEKREEEAMSVEERISKCVPDLS